jgi:hypothetical protein
MLSFSPTKILSTYESRKPTNPTSDLSHSLVFSNLPFLPGLSSGSTSWKNKIVYFSPSINDQGPKGLILSPLSPEGGDVVMSKFGASSKAQSDLKNEVMVGYSWGGSIDNPQPLSLGSSYNFGTFNNLRSSQEQRSESSPLVNGNDIITD